MGVPRDTGKPNGSAGTNDTDYLQELLRVAAMREKTRRLNPMPGAEKQSVTGATVGEPEFEGLEPATIVPTPQLQVGRPEQSGVIMGEGVDLEVGRPVNARTGKSYKTGRGGRLKAKEQLKIGEPEFEPQPKETKEAPVARRQIKSLREEYKKAKTAKQRRAVLRTLQALTGRRTAIRA